MDRTMNMEIDNLSNKIKESFKERIKTNMRNLDLGRTFADYFTKSLCKISVHFFPILPFHYNNLISHCNIFEKYNILT